jgi:Beta-propeller repeat
MGAIGITPFQRLKEGILKMGLKTLARIFLAMSLVSVWPAGPISAAAQEPTQTKALQGMLAPASYGNLPLRFEINHGQSSSQVKFLSRGKGYTAFLTSGGMVLSLRPSLAAPMPQTNEGTAPNTSRQTATTTLQFMLVGASPNPIVIGEDPLPGRVNYFIGNDSTKWHTNVLTYAKVRYKNVYPGIDLLYYGNHRQLEYDFAVSAGADPSQIQFKITGANQIQLDADGNLILQTGSGELHFQNPVIYQESQGRRIPVAGSYVLTDPTHVGFRVAQYDSNKALVIDPLLVYSTYLGGSGDDQPAGVAVDSTGSVYIAGYTDSTDFPLATLGSLPSGSTHVFVAKLDPTGSNLVYADYIGGSSDDYGYALALDGSDDVYVTGSTASSNFPVMNPYQGSYPGGFNAFLTKISADGSSLSYSTYLGGSGSDVPSSIAFDGLGEVIIAGNTTSTNFPTANAYQSAVSPNQGGVSGNNGFVSKFSPDGSTLVYSTYLGGNSNVPLNCGGTTCWPSPYSAVSGIAVDGNGNIYASGVTNTNNFPTTQNAYLTIDSAQQNAIVGFVSKLSSAGALDYSTYFYESSGLLTNVNAIAVDASGSAYITGAAFSDGTFPVTSTTICDPGVYGFGCSYAFVAKFDAEGSTLLYSTFLGPNNDANPSAIVLDTNNDAYIVGSTSSGSFGMVGGIEPYTSGSDLLLVEIDPLASAQLFATYLGASGDESPAGIALDSSGNIYVAGSTDSTDFPTTPGSIQNVLGGGTDGFVAKIGANSAPAVSVSPSSLQYPLQAVGSTSQPQTVLLRNMGSAPLTISSITAAGDFAETDNCATGVPAAGSCTFSVTFTPSAEGARSGSILVQDDAAGSPHAITLSGSGLGAVAALVPGSVAFSSQQINTSSAAQAVTLTNTGNATMNISSVQVTGDFFQTNTCSAALASASSCTVNITFAPTASGSRNGTLTINTGVGSPLTANLSGSGSDFSVTSAPSTDTLKAGATASYQLNVSAVGGAFTNVVKLSCSGSPALTTCKISPSSVTPNGSTATAVLTITTTASVAQSSPTDPRSSHPIYAVWMQLQGFGLFGMMLAGSKRRSRKLRMFALLALILAMSMLMVACAGGTGITPTHQTPQAGTTPGSFTVTVTGTSGGLQHSVPLTLTVQ